MYWFRKLWIKLIHVMRTENCHTQLKKVMMGLYLSTLKISESNWNLYIEKLIVFIPIMHHNSQNNVIAKLTPTLIGHFSSVTTTTILTQIIAFKRKLKMV